MKGEPGSCFICSGLWPMERESLRVTDEEIAYLLRLRCPHGGYACELAIRDDDRDVFAAYEVERVVDPDQRSGELIALAVEGFQLTPAPIAPLGELRRKARR